MWLGFGLGSGGLPVFPEIETAMNEKWGSEKTFIQKKFLNLNLSSVIINRLSQPSTEIFILDNNK